MAPFSRLSDELSVEDLYNGIASMYDLEERRVAVGGAQFTLVQVRDTNKLLDEIPPDRFAVDERLPYWAELWTASIDLARYCLEEADLSGRRVLELGCGLGLAGIAAASAGAAVTMTDYDDEALRFARYNAMRNLPAEALPRTHIRRLDWRADDAGDLFDVILGADVAYERKSFAPLLSVVRRSLHPRGWAVFTDPGREIGRDFFTFACASGFRGVQSTHRVLHAGREQTVARLLLFINPAEGRPVGGDS